MTKQHGSSSSSKADGNVSSLSHGAASHHQRPLGIIPDARRCNLWAKRKLETFLPLLSYVNNRRHKEIVDSMTNGEVPVRDMGRVGKELGRLETVLEKQGKVEDKTAEIQDLEEVRRYIGWSWVS